MPTQEQRAKDRYAFMADFIKEKGSISFKMLASMMFIEHGVMERTVRRYLGVMFTLGVVTSEGKTYDPTITWVVKK